MTPTTSRRSILAGIAVGTVAGVAGCLADGREVEESVTERRSAADLSAVAVSTAIGDVTVRPTSRDEVIVDGRKAAVSPDDLETIGLETTTNGDCLELTVKRDESRTLFGFRPVPVLDLSVAVPERLAVQSVDTRTGEIDVSDVRGDLTAVTETGAVRAEAVDGTVSATTEAGAIDLVDPASIERLETDSGDVTATLPDIERDATIETSSGDVELRLPDELDLTLDITTDSGEITVSDVAALPEMAGDSLIEAVVGQGTHRLEVRTVTGNVTVTGRERSNE
ncbi:DUF4097 family beta strand repeat-containing protein [Haloterrigena salifodinae]|uniref:DUF4097 family beta strand repeat-containing protein n=1 Tax=Haloterrigena salifodinae TaxID=2675099 RepID=UPI000F86E033|nr:DUF4097 family beta strand repeat-containing protein [Haloterrigena salifodinae]